MRGSGRGAASDVANQFTRATARWLAHSSKSSPNKTSAHPCNPSAYALIARLAAIIAVSSRMAPP